MSLCVVPAPNYEQIEMTWGIVRIWCTSKVIKSLYWTEIERERMRTTDLAIVRLEVNS